MGLFLLFLAGISGAAQSAELTASVDRNEISLEETLSLTVRYSDQVMFGEPDFSALEENFDILGNRRANQYRSINGKAESWTQWTLVVAPKSTGKLLIPSFEFEGVFSDAIEIDVAKTAPKTDLPSEQPVFLETELQKPEGYVQEQFLYTIRLYTSVDLSSLNSEEFSVADALVKQVAENQYQRTINGRRFGIVEVTYAIFPQRSGKLTLPSTLWNITIQSSQSYNYDPFLARSGKRLRLRTEEKVVDVQPRPADFDGQQWLPASNISLTQKWNRDPSEFRVGEPITRTISIDANGLLASQLPPLKLEEVDGIKYYPDQPQSDETLSAEGVKTLKTESYAIVPNREGEFTLPAINVTWWNTQESKMETASLPEETITVAPGTAPATPPPVAPTENSTDETTSALLPSGNISLPIDQPALPVASYWVSLTGVFAATTLLFAILWWRARGRIPVQRSLSSPARNTSPSEAETFRQLKTAVQEKTPQQIRTALMAWGSSRQRETVTALGQLRNPHLRVAVSHLQTCLYGAETREPDRTLLQEAIMNARRHKESAEGATSHEVIAPLYS